MLSDAEADVLSELLSVSEELLCEDVEVLSETLVLDESELVETELYELSEFKDKSDKSDKFDSLPDLQPVNIKTAKIAVMIVKLFFVMIPPDLNFKLLVYLCFKILFIVYCQLSTVNCFRALSGKSDISVVVRHKQGGTLFIKGQQHGLHAEKLLCLVPELGYALVLRHKVRLL